MENCQIGVFLTYASKKGHSAIDRRLYMPEDWTDGDSRRKGAGVPETLKFQTKPQMTLEMIQSAAASGGIPHKWVTGDSVYGDYTKIRLWLEQNGKRYERIRQGVYLARNRASVNISSFLKNLPEEGWFTESRGDGSKGARLYDWYLQEINQSAAEGFKRWVLVRGSRVKPDELRAYIRGAPAETAPKELIETAGTRWTVKTCFKESKGETGLTNMKSEVTTDGTSVLRWRVLRWHF